MYRAPAVLLLLALLVESILGLPSRAGTLPDSRPSTALRCGSCSCQRQTCCNQAPAEEPSRDPIPAQTPPRAKEQALIPPAPIPFCSACPPEPSDLLASTGSRACAASEVPRFLQYCALLL